MTTAPPEARTDHDATDIPVMVWLPRKVFAFCLEAHPDIHRKADLARLMREMMEEVYRMDAEEQPR